MTLNTIKHGYCIAAGVVGGIFVTLWGDWNLALTILSFAMLVDIITGLLVACIFGESPKSLYGGLSSKSFAKGIVKKVGVFAVIWVAHGLDAMLNVDYLRNAAIVAFIAAEFISILENCALMGVPIPKVLLRAIDVLKQQGKEREASGASADAEASGDASLRVRENRADVGIGSYEAAETVADAHQAEVDRKEGLK